MAINDFNTFATSSTANVYTTAEYLADTDQLNGNQPGIAKSKLVNKALRQSSIMSTVVAQLISDLSGADALDDGTTTTLLNNLKAIFNAKAPLASPTFTGTVQLPTSTSIGSISSAELGYLDGTTSAIQTQLNAKAPLASPTFTGTVGLPASTSIGNVSSNEIGYLDGVTSSIQTQLNAKASSVSPTFTGTPTAPTAPVGTNTTQLATTEFVLDNSISKPVITYMSKSGYNSQALVIDGKLYTANGTTGSYGAYTSGVYNNGANTKFGVMNGWSSVNIPSVATIVKVGGFMHEYAFALMSDGNLFTWGYNSNGACGLGHTTNTVHPTLAATGVLDVYTHPSQGEYSVNHNRLFILKSDGLYATGVNGNGQLGINSTTSVNTFTKCTGFNNTDSSYILQVFPIANYGSTWVLTSDKKLWVTGSNLQGSHGVGNTTQHNQFIDVTSNWVASGKTLSSIKVTGGSRYYDTADSGVQEVMVLLLKYTDGTSEVKTAGHNGWSSLGSGNTTNSSTPISPAGVPKDGTVIDITGFGSSPLTVQALCSNGDLWAWGYNGQGQVGDGTTTHRNTPTKVTTGVTKLLSDGMTSHYYGYNTQSFIQKADGLYMCGQNDGSYYAGMGVTVTGSVLTHQKVLLPQDDNNVVDMGHFTTTTHGRILLALTSKGNIYVWGYNGHNGIHTDNANSVPVPQLIQLPKRSN